MPGPSDLLKKTTRKKKRKVTEDREPVDSVDEESVDASPIQVLHSNQGTGWYRILKATKNRLRTDGPSNVSRPVPSGPSDVSQAVSRPKSEKEEWFLHP